MRKLMIVVTQVVMLVPLFAAAAFAADQLIYCKSAPCYGSGNDDKIYERKGNRVFDKIIMKGGHDLILANGGRTRVSVRLRRAKPAADVRVAPFLVSCGPCTGDPNRIPGLLVVLKRFAEVSTYSESRIRLRAKTIS